MSLRKDVQANIRREYASHLGRLREFMAQPSISLENLGIRECAGLLVRYLRELGCAEAETVETPGLPAVWAYYDAGAPRTLAVYGYFDTNVVGSGWKHSPFDCVVEPSAPFANVLYCRGANTKAGLLALVNALFSMQAVGGTLPVNLMFLCEGEEFLGSEHIPMLIERYRGRLVQCEGLLSPGAAQLMTGEVSFALGNKGGLAVEFECTGDRWGRGPAGGPVHSSTQGVVDHPVWRLVHALATLYDPVANRILVDGFCDGLRAPSEEDMVLVDALAAKFKGREGSSIGVAKRVSRFANDATGRDFFLRYCFQPTMNINGLRAGYTGPGTTLWTLPHAAYCTMDCRLPPDLDPQVCLQRLRAHLDRNGFADIGMRVLMSVRDTKLSINDALAQATLRVYRERGLQSVVWPRRGASGPTGVFSQLLGVKVLGATGAGYATGHSEPNEFLVVEGDGKVGGLVELEQSFADLLYSYAAYPGPF